MKYVILIVSNKRTGVKRVYPFVFAEWSVHSMVARHMQRMVGYETGVMPEVFSAGFCEPIGDEFAVITHGSESLNMKPDRSLCKRDEQLLNMPNALQGIVP